MKGILSARLLARIHEEAPSFLSNVDLIAGTSSGAVIAAFLALGKSPAECVELSREYVSKAFHQPLLRLSPHNASYSDDKKRQLLKHITEHKTFADIDQWILIPAFNLSAEPIRTNTTFFESGRWRPALFTNVPRASGLVDPDVHVTLLDALMASSAAPTLFPIYHFTTGCISESHDSYIDGGIFANNPSMVAVTKVLGHFPEVRDSGLAVLSIGSGISPQRMQFKEDEGDWGEVQWAPNFLNVFFDASGRNVNLSMTNLLGPDYLRVNVHLGKDVAMDDVKMLEYLIKEADEVDLGPALEFIQKKFLDEEMRPTAWELEKDTP